ncbi:MAG: DNA-binding domain-containing protein [Pseudomonadota bacterium]
MTTQLDLTEAILGSERPVPAGLSDGQGRAAGKRFDVYRNNVAVSLTEALVTAFPTIHGLVGDAFFRAMAGVFLRQHPPSSPLMMFYGAQMPDFLRRFEPAASLPYLPDAARLDLALRHAYHAQDVTPLPREALDIPPEALMDARLGLAPATQIIRSPYPLYDIWQLQRGGPKPGKGAQDVLVSRPAYDPVVDALPPGAPGLLEALQKGQTVEAAVDASGIDPETALAPTISLALQRGLFTTLN